MVPARANSFSFLVPVFGLTMGALFYGETLGWPEFVGIGLTLLGIGLVNRKAWTMPQNLG